MTYQGIVFDFNGTLLWDMDLHEQVWHQVCQRYLGRDVTADELRETAKRIVSAKRQFNLLAGWTPAEDTLPDRFLNTPLPNDPEASLSRELLNSLVAEYHRQRGW